MKEVLKAVAKLMIGHRATEITEKNPIVPHCGLGASVAHLLEFLKETRVNRIKRPLLAAVALLVAAGAALAQDSLEENLQKKMKEPFLAKAGWITEFDKAKAESKKMNKPIFAYFTRSYSP